MAFHPFAIYSEQGEEAVKSAEYLALFAPDATLHSPFLVMPMHGKQLTVKFLNEAFAFVGYPKYKKQLTDNKYTTIFLWQGNVQGYVIEGSMVIVEGEDGLIHEARSYLRPLQVVGLLRDLLIPSAAAALSRDFWEASPLGFAGDPALLENHATLGFTGDPALLEKHTTPDPAAKRSR